MGVVSKIRSVFSKKPSSNQGSSSNSATTSSNQSIGGGSSGVTWSGGQPSGFTTGGTTAVQQFQQAGATINPSFSGGGSSSTTQASTTTTPSSSSVIQNQVPSKDSFITTTNKPTDYTLNRIEQQKQADFLRRGEFEMFGGASYNTLNPVQKRGTATITNITPFTNERMVNLIGFTGGANIVLQEREQRDVDILYGGIASNVEFELLPKFQDKVTPTTTPKELEKINSEFNKQFTEEVTSRASPGLKDINLKYGKLRENLEVTQIKESVLKSLPILTGVTVATAGIGGLTIGGTSMGTILGGTAVAGGTATALSTIMNPKSLKLKYESSGELIEGTNITKPATFYTSYTPSATYNLAMGTAGIIGGATGVIGGIESSMYKSEIQRITAPLKQEVEPTFTIRNIKGSKFIDITYATKGKAGIGTAKLEQVTITGGVQRQGGGFSYGQQSYTTITGETAWNYNFGNKFILLSGTESSGSGLTLPSSSDKLSYSISNVNKQTSVGGGVVYKGELTPKALTKFESSIKVLPSESKYPSFGVSAKVSENTYLTKSMDLRGLALDNRFGNTDWAALTGTTRQTGILKVVDKSSFGRVFTISGGGTSSISQINSLPLVSTTPTFPVISTGSQGTAVLSAVSSVSTTPKDATIPKTSIGGGITGFSTLDTSTKTETIPLTTTTQVTTPTIEESTTNLGRLVMPNTTTVGTSTKEISNVTPITSSATKMDLSITNKSLTGVSGISGITSTFSAPNLNKGFAITPITFNFGTPLDFGGISKKNRIGKTRSKYTPSLGALVFGIKGKKPKGIETGLKIRPITKGFRWEFGRSKLKIGKFKF